MIDKKTINVDREYSTKQFADVMNEAHEDMEVCGNLLGHALIEFSNILFRSDKRLVPWSLVSSQKKAYCPTGVDALELPERRRCFTFRVLGDYNFSGCVDIDFAKRVKFCYVELMRALDLNPFQSAVAPEVGSKENSLKRRKPYDELSDKWRRQVARTHVQEAKGKLMEEFGCGEGVALETLKDIFSSCSQQAPSSDKGDWSRLSQLGLDQGRVDEMVSSLGVVGQRRRSNREKAEMASIFAKARSEAELCAHFKALEEKSKRSSVATAVAKSLSKLEGFASLKNRTLLRIVDQQSRSMKKRGKVRSAEFRLDV